MPDLTPTRPTSGTPIESSWGQQVHDAIEGIQAGAAVVACTAQVRQDYVLTFPRAYVTPPIVVVTAVGGQTNLAGLVSLPTTTAVTVGVFKRDGTNLAVGNVTVEWVAVGTPA